MKRRLRILVRFVKWAGFAAGGLLALAIVMGLGGVASPFPVTEVSHEKPYVDFVGREYRVTGDVRALAWNDFPDKTTIVSISLMSPPVVRHRFVSFETRLKPGQRVRIVSAWRQFALVEFARHYGVSVPGAGLPDGVTVSMYVRSDGVSDPLVYEPLGN